jgi:exopolyphosphatase / guanosine-5'-triphosphate,3'-diphosphate pyrophosphatase
VSDQQDSSQLQGLPAVTPRWEWRAFGDELAGVLAGFEPESRQESDELYLVSVAGRDIVKVRDGLLDVKQLEQVDQAGLEQWRPTLKAPFPVSAAEAARTLAGLGVPDPVLDADAYSLDRLLDDVVRPHPELRAVEVRKRRERHVVGGCPAESTAVETPYGSTHTVAVESEDPQLVVAALRELGLEGRPNLNYARGLEELLRRSARRVAVIDVGTNSVKLHVAEHGSGGRWCTVADRAVVTRLGEGLDETGRLQPEPMTRTADAVAELADEARELGAEHIVAVGTAALRIAPNADELLAYARERGDVGIEVISGEEEGRLAGLAARVAVALDHATVVVFDSGGGSSQFSFWQGDDLEERFSVNVGAVRVTERFGLDGAVDEPTVVDALAAIAEDLVRLDGRPVPAAVVGMGGAVTNLAAVRHGLGAYDPDVVHGSLLDLAELDRQIELYRTRNADERRTIPGLQPQRAEVILAGACIVRTVLAKLRRDELVVSDRGLRHGVLLDRFGTVDPSAYER